MSTSLSHRGRARSKPAALAVRRDIDPADYLRDLSVEADRLKTIGAEGGEIGVEASLGRRDGEGNRRR